jgi:hypothetical protein
MKRLTTVISKFIYKNLLVFYYQRLTQKFFLIFTLSLGLVKGRGVGVVWGGGEVGE